MRIAIAGASGRMGKMLIQAVLEAEDMTLTAALDHADSSSLNTDAGAFLGIATGVKITADLNAIKLADCLIDFTRPQGTLAHLQICAEHKIKCVIGTTGFDTSGKQKIHQAAQNTAIVFAPNMSIGVNATLKLLAQAAKMLDSSYDVEILEAHHHHKVDAPSGTALAMGEAIAKARGVNLDEVADWARHGDTGARQTGNIGFAVIRGGDIVGDHTVYFCGAGERIEITHRSNNRATYAQGSIQAARYLARHDFGLFDMQDVIAG